MADANDGRVTHYPALEAALARDGRLDIAYRGGWYRVTLYRAAAPFKVETACGHLGAALQTLEDLVVGHRSVGVGDHGTGTSKA